MSPNRTAWQQSEWEQTHSAEHNPFDLEQPYEWVAALEDAGKIRGTILDLGCGAGHNGIYLASKGYQVIGVDLASTAIERAKKKAAAKKVAIEFAQRNVCEPLGFDANFDTVLDIGCFHSLAEEDHARYVASLHRACRPGATLFMRAFSDFNAKQDIVFEGKLFHPPAVSEEQLRKAFSCGWFITNLHHEKIELRELGVIGDNNQTANVWFAQIDFDPSVSPYVPRTRRA